MADRRRYTGTRILQVAWTVLVAALIATLESLVPGVAPVVVTVGGGGVLWLVGLVALGLRERRHWNRLVAESSYDHGLSGHTADFEAIVRGKSVTAATDVTGLLSPDNTEIRTRVEGVDASFRVRIVADELADTDGLRTGDDALDDRYAITGSEENVAAILTEEIRDALLAVEAPGEFTLRPDAVVFEVPFTDLTPAELEAAGDAVAILALRLEDVGQR